MKNETDHEKEFWKRGLLDSLSGTAPLSVETYKKITETQEDFWRRALAQEIHEEFVKHTRTKGAPKP